MRDILNLDVILSIIGFILIWCVLLGGFWLFGWFLNNLDIPKSPIDLTIRTGSILALFSVSYLALLICTKPKSRKRWLFPFGIFFIGSAVTLLDNNAFVSYYDELNIGIAFLYFLGCILMGIIGAIALVFLLLPIVMLTSYEEWKSKEAEVSDKIKELRSFYKNDDNDFNDLFKDIQGKVSSLNAFDGGENMIRVVLSIFNSVAALIYIFLWVRGWV